MLRNRWGLRLLLLGSVLALTSGLQKTAAAQTDGGTNANYDWQSNNSGGYFGHLGGTWTVDVNGQSKTFGGAGIFRGNTNIITGNNVSTTVSTVSVCADLFGFIGTPNPAAVTTFDVNQLTAAKLPTNPTYVTPNGAVSNKHLINYLLDNVMGKDASNFVTNTNLLATVYSGVNTGLNASTNTDVRAAAFQTAIWKLWYDADNLSNTESVTTNSGGTGFKLTGAGSGNITQIAAIADAYIAAAKGQGLNFSSNRSWYLRDANDNGSPQSQLISIGDAPPIPEPAFYQMAGLLSLGLIGARRFRKTRKA